jgi:exodeoxyribonuclease VII large subunit
VPDRVELAHRVGLAHAALCAALSRRVRSARERVEELQRRLGSPRRRLEVTWQRVDELRDRLPLALRRRAVWERRELRGLATRLAQAGPAARTAAARRHLDGLAARLRTALAVRLREARAHVAAQAGRLDALSPLACLARGYAIVRRGAADGPVVQDATALAPGDAVTLVLAHGRANARIIDTET